MRRLLWVLLLVVPHLACAESVSDATGRTVSVPAHVARVLPAGPPAALLLLAVAPDLMLGFPSPVSDATRKLLPDEAMVLPTIPRLTGKTDQTTAIRALKPDLILDYGTVAPRYTELAIATQERTGVPTVLLDGALDQIPHALRLLGGLLHREARAAMLARVAEALLTLPPRAGPPPSVVYARGADGLTVVAPNNGASEIFTRLGWRVLAPAGDGWFRPSSIEAIAALDPDILIFSDPAMRDVLAQPGAWRDLRAVRDGHAYVAPSLPFSWIEDPPSVNRLLGLAWLQGRDATTLAALFSATFYDHVLTPPQLDAVLSGLSSRHP